MRKVENRQCYQGLWRCGGSVLRTPYWYYVLRTGTTARYLILYPIGVVLYPISEAQEVHAVRASLGLRYAGCRSVDPLPIQ